MSLSPAFAEALAAGRPRLNARVAAVRAAQPAFDPDALAAVLRERLDPVVAAVAQVAPARARPVAEAGFGLALTLVARGLVGPRVEVAGRAWSELAPRLAPVVAEQPALVLALLANAALRLADMPGARLDEWLQRMAALGPRTTLDTLKPLGQVVAWLCGMAHYRQGALAAADTLPADLALAALGAQGEWAQVRAEAAANPWWSPEPAAAVRGRRFGGFTGFGGPFAEPPQARAATDGFLVRSAGRHGFLVVDAWGATLHPATAEEFDRADPAQLQVTSAGVPAGDRAIALDLPAEGLTAVANGDSVAIVSSYSHAVGLHPWRLT